MIISNGFENRSTDTFSQSKTNVKSFDITPGSEGSFLSALKGLQQTSDLNIEQNRQQKVLFSGFHQVEQTSEAKEAENPVENKAKAAEEEHKPKQDTGKVENKVEESSKSDKIAQNDQVREEKVTQSKTPQNDEKRTENDTEEEDELKKSEKAKNVKRTKLEFPELKETKLETEADENVIKKQSGKSNIVANANVEEQKQTQKSDKENLAETKIQAKDLDISNKYESNTQKFRNTKLSIEKNTQQVNTKENQETKQDSKIEIPQELKQQSSSLEELDDDVRKKISRVVENKTQNVKEKTPENQQFQKEMETSEKAEMVDPKARFNRQADSKQMAKEIPIQEDGNVIENNPKKETEPKVDLAKLDKDNKWEVIRERRESVVSQSIAAKDNIQTPKQQNINQDKILENTNQNSVSKIQTEVKSDNLDFSEFANPSNKETLLDRFKSILSGKLWNRSDMQKSFQDLIKQVRIHIIDRGKSTAQIQLHPRELGKMTLKIEVLNDKMEGRIFVESEAVKNLILSDLNQLRTDLKSAGIELENMFVDVKEEETGEQQLAGFEENLNNEKGFGDSQLSQTDSNEEEIFDETDLVDNKYSLSSNKLLDIRI